MKSTNKPSKKKVCNYMICLDNPLGQGATGKVYLAYSVSNPEIFFAVKVIDKKLIEGNQYMEKALRREFIIHSKLKHKNIVNLIQMHETLNNIYIFQEYCEGKTLRDILHQKKRLTEDQVIICIKKICSGYKELVKRGIIHRDLKPENIMVSNGELKIGDFGFAKTINTQKQMLTSIVGSPIYMAPQILKGQKYNSKCDVWSLGVMVYELIFGRFPWQTRGPQNVISLLKILIEPLKFPTEPEVSQTLKKFIQQCLQTSEKERLSWLQIFQHNIFQDDPQFIQFAQVYRSYAISATELLNNLAEEVQAFQLIGAFLQFRVKAMDYKIFSTIIQGYLIPSANQLEVSIMYEMFDKDCNGVIDIEQFVKAFQICQDQVLSLLNFLITEKNMIYQDLVIWDSFQKQSSQSAKYSLNTIQRAFKIISMIRYQ